MEPQDHWQLNPNIDFLNHGSFGATPTAVLQVQRAIIESLERDPIRYLAPERELEPKLDHVRAILANRIQASAHDIAFVRNATDGVNAVLRSFPLAEGDEIVVTNHGYNACINAAEYAAARAGAKVRVAEIPFPLHDTTQILDAIAREISRRTRLLLVDHVTSPTGIVFPVASLVDMARAHRVRVLIDGAHAPGMIPLNLAELQPDYYTANHHKWLCAPKVSGFLYVRPEWQAEVRPTVISHAANRPRPNRSRFIAEFDWTGTFDPSPLLSLPAAIEFLDTLHPNGLQGLMTANRAMALDARRLLCDALGIESPCPEAMIGSLVSLPVTTSRDANRVARWLVEEQRFELPVFRSPCSDHVIVRIAMQAYNHLGQIERLASVLPSAFADRD